MTQMPELQEACGRPEDRGTGADEVDGCLPRRPRGRPVRRMTGDVFAPTRSRHHCLECPKYGGPATQWCPAGAMTRPPQTPLCRYGLVLFNAARLKERRKGGMTCKN